MCDFMMASSNGACKEGIMIHGSSTTTGKSHHVHGEWGVPTFQHQQNISMDWTSEEQAILEDCLAKYASESNIIRYAKISVRLKSKTVRDVALRCRWMTKKDINKKRKEELSARKTKDRKEKIVDCCGKPSRLDIQSSLSHAPGMLPNRNDNSFAYNDISGATTQLLQHNAWAFKQISANLVTHQIRENIGLLGIARDNIFQILTNLNYINPTMKKMPLLPLVNEDLANSILPPLNFPVQL